MLDVRQKRRIYDITNVLEGIGLIEKETKNTIRWKCVCVCMCVCGCVHPSASFLGHKEDGNDVSMRVLGYGEWVTLFVAAYSK